MNYVAEIQRIADKLAIDFYHVLAELDSESDCHLFDEWLEETHPTIEILGMSYCPSRVLLEVDPTAYNCEVADYVDGLVSSGQYCTFDEEIYYLCDDLDALIEEHAHLFEEEEESLC